MIRNFLTAAWDMLNEDPLWCLVAVCVVGMAIYAACMIWHQLN